MTKGGGMSSLYINEAGEVMMRRAPPKIMWCVDHGPDESHLIDTDWFERLRDAKEFVSKLKPASGGVSRPYKITKYDWRKSNVYGTSVSTTLVETNIPRSAA